MKKPQDSPWGEITGPEPEITEVAGISCHDPGRGAGRLVRGLMLVTGALVPDCSGSRSRIVSSTRERSSPVNTGSSVSNSSNELSRDPVRLQ